MHTSTRLPFRFCATLLATFLAAGAARPQAPADALPAGQRIFVAGHSFHLPIVTPLDETAKAAHIPGHKIAGTQMIGGSTVSQHWNLPDDKDKARKALRTGEIDVLTLSPHLLMPDPAIDKFTSLLLEHNPKGRVTVQASWFPFDGPGRLKVTPEERDAADPSAFRKSWAFVGDKFREQVRSINDTYAAKMHRPVAFLVPSGEAVIRLRERVAKGEVPGIARQSALFRDALGHGTAPLGVLNAYCHYAVIYGRNPVGLPVPEMLKSANLGDNTYKVNRILQECAWEAVLAEPASGVKAGK